MRILAIRLSAYGDIAVSFPALVALRKFFPQARIDFLLARRYRAIAPLIPEVSRVHLWDYPAGRRGPVTFFGSLPQTMGLIPRLLCRYLLVVDLQNNARSRLLSALILPRRVVRASRDPRTNAIRRYLSALDELGGNFPLGELIPVSPPPEPLAEARELLEGAGLAGRGPLVGLNPACKVASKLWPLDRFGELARRIIGELDARIVLTGDREERPRAEEIARHLPPDRVLITSGELPLPVSAALISLLDLFVTLDSGLMHLAWVYGVPTVGIFGPTDPRWCGIPKEVRGVNLGGPSQACEGCRLRLTPHGEHTCIREVSVEEVFSACLSLAQHR